MSSIQRTYGLAPLRDFRRTWPQLLLTDLLARAVAVVVLTPVVALLLKLFLIRTDTGVLSDQDILLFLLHPFGLLGLVIVLAVVLGMLFLEVGLLMVIGFGAVEDRRVTYLEGLKYVLRSIVPLIDLARRAVTRLLLLSLPFAAAVGAVYALMLRKHDINYYLALEPPEYWRAVIMAAVILLALAVVLTRQFAAWILALPMVLFEGRSGKDALRSSREATTGAHWRIAGALAAWVAGVSLVTWLATFVVGRIGSLLFSVSRDLTWLAVSLSGVLLMGALTNLAVSVFATSVFPLAVVRLYRSMAGPGRLRPEIDSARSLGSRPTVHVPGKLMLFGGAAALLLIVGGGLYLVAQLDEEDRAVIIAHRGASKAAPENSMAAFERAIADGADWIELDVQENGDGEVVVQHDSDFMKQAGNPLQAWNATDADLREIDIGSWFAPEFSDQRVPTLREALELARGKLGVFIELKYYGHDRELESKVVQIVETAEMESSIVIMSLDHRGLRKTAAIRPEWTYGLLTTVNVGDPTRLKLGFLAVNSGAATPALIRRAHKRGMKIYAWTVNDPIQMSMLLSRGVDGLITDEPELARRVMELRAELTPLGRAIVWAAGEAGMLRKLVGAQEIEDV